MIDPTLHSGSRPFMDDNDRDLRRAGGAGSPRFSLSPSRQQGVTTADIVGVILLVLLLLGAVLIFV
jgi:hypothetical protein